MYCNGKRFFADDDKVEIRKLLGAAGDTRSKRQTSWVGTCVVRIARTIAKCAGMVLGDVCALFIAVVF